MFIYPLSSLPPLFLSLFQNIQHRKYARWKATYIHNCLKSGETPQAGPDGYEEETYGKDLYYISTAYQHCDSNKQCLPLRKYLFSWPFLQEPLDLLSSVWVTRYFSW